MKQTYTIEGMTCKGCTETVTRHLEGVAGVADVKVDLETEEVTLSMDKAVVMEDLKRVLPKKYQLLEKGKETRKKVLSEKREDETTSKLQQLKPLLLILFYIATASILIHRKNLAMEGIMLDFMGLFYIVFSFFKLLDLRGFPSSFSMYDPLAMRFPLYGKIYPFIEVVLGLFFLLRFEVEFALMITIIILGITTVGVTKSLLDKKKIRCACLGTALKLPMTEATFIENAIMIVMAGVLLLKLL
ncbi:heavy-metal-associated domain-containing protein [Spongiimicrobium salis]|uniref:heavy-metal-associated domain-containing protein n=1 Tax=Spongiimicrobium salis TaxID=1667022 RepID=UPI00374CBAF3